MVAQAAHIPVHLGSMPASVEAALAVFARPQEGRPSTSSPRAVRSPVRPAPRGALSGVNGFVEGRHRRTAATLSEGDLVILNDPYMGGTHLNDVTLVAPVFADGELVGFVANRGHHADIGGMTPGSLPLSTELYQEGFIFPPLRLARRGRVNQEVVELFCRNSRMPEERRGDLSAQIAACRTGERRLTELVARYGAGEVGEHMTALLDYSERLTRAAISEIPDGEYSFEDVLDDDGFSDEPVPIRATLRVRGDEMEVDFTG
ncbi:MAG: hydantoinase B/oxoprolinase family protein, partial [SAR202 cluster bacterium]|nr:hydantoinase B/oxoprolinase family protein [SAR202 cluster bacterium]